VENFRVIGGRFSFSLLNDENSGRAAQGSILMLFGIELPDGTKQVIAFPDFDPASPDPNFNLGPGYNIRAGKTVDGRIPLPEGAVVKNLMVAAKSRGGNIVMKKTLTPEE
jgi:hypothetical protein